MEQNVGVLDQVVRVCIGFACLGLAFISPPPLKYVAYAACIVFAVTGFAGKCWLYKLVGLSTARKAAG